MALGITMSQTACACRAMFLFVCFSKSAHLDCFTRDTALPWVLSNTPVKCEVSWMNGCRENQKTDRHKYRQMPSFIYSVWKAE